MRIMDARDTHGVTSREHYLRHHASLMAMAERGVWRAPGPLVMEISWGYWIATCRHCTHGLSGQRAWQVACCYTCGAVYLSEQIVWPVDVNAIEAALLARPDQLNRGWMPSIRHQTVSDLIAENIEHGVLTL